MAKRKGFQGKRHSLSARAKHLAGKSKLILKDKLTIMGISHKNFRLFYTTFCTDPFAGYRIRVWKGRSWEPWSDWPSKLPPKYVADHLLQNLRTGLRNGKPIKPKLFSRGFSNRFGLYVTIDVDYHSPNYSTKKWKRLRPRVKKFVKQLRGTLPGLLPMLSSGSGCAHLLLKLHNPYEIKKARRIIYKIVKRVRKAKRSAVSVEVFPDGRKKLRLPFGWESATLNNRLNPVARTAADQLRRLIRFQFHEYTLAGLRTILGKLQGVKRKKPKVKHAKANKAAKSLAVSSKPKQKPTQAQKGKPKPATQKRNSANAILGTGKSGRLEKVVERAVKRGWLNPNNAYNAKALAFVKNGYSKGEANEAFIAIAFILLQAIGIEKEKATELLCDWVERRAYDQSPKYQKSVLDRARRLIQGQEINKAVGFRRAGLNGPKKLSKRQAKVILDYLRGLSMDGQPRFKLGRFLFAVVKMFNQYQNQVQPISWTLFEGLPEGGSRRYRKHLNRLIKGRVLKKVSKPVKGVATSYQLNRKFLLGTGKPFYSTFKSAVSILSYGERAKLFTPYYADITA